MKSPMHMEKNPAIGIGPGAVNLLALLILPWEGEANLRPQDWISGLIHNLDHVPFGNIPVVDRQPAIVAAIKQIIIPLGIIIHLAGPQWSRLHNGH